MEYAIARKQIPNALHPFFDKLHTALNNGDNETDHMSLVLYGSVIRSDFVMGKSDVDASIFTDNEESAMNILQGVMRIQRNQFHKIVWRLNDMMVHGFKVKCTIECTQGGYSVPCEISIYNNDYRAELLEEYQIPLKNQPFYIYCMLFILKMVYYQIPLISKNTYQESKRFILNRLMSNKNTYFITMPYQELY